MSFVEIPEENKLVLFIPKCRKCKGSMTRDQIRGIIKQDEIGTRNIHGGFGDLQETIQNATVAPSITTLNLTYRCQRHPDIWWEADMNMIFAMNRYPPGNIEYRHMDY